MSAFISMTLRTSPWLLYCAVIENGIVGKELWSTFCDLRCCQFYVWGTWREKCTWI